MVAGLCAHKTVPRKELKNVAEARTALFFDGRLNEEGSQDLSHDAAFLLIVFLLVLIVPGRLITRFAQRHSEAVSRARGPPNGSVCRVRVSLNC